MKINREKTRKLSGSSIKDNIQWGLLILPVIIYVFVMSYLPMGGLVIAFKDFKYHLGVFGSRWNGFKNFEFFFRSQDMWRIVRNTVGYAGVFIILGIVCAVVVALLLFEIKSRLSIKFYQTSMILPNFMSWVIVSYIAYIILNPRYGILNQFIGVFGKEPIDWYSDPKYWPYILTFFNVWKTIGLNTIMYYAALMSIDASLYEAAKIDGANKLQQCIHISVPELLPIMTVLLILHIGNIFRGDFGLFYQIPRDIGTLYPTTDVIDTYIYRGLRTGNISVTTAVGFIQSFVGLVMVLATNAIVRKISPENAMF